MLNPQFRAVGFPCQGNDKMTQAAGGACCAPSDSDVKYEALPYDLVLHPEVLSPLPSKTRLFPGAYSWNLGKGSSVWVLTGLNQQIRGPTFHQD